MNQCNRSRQRAQSSVIAGLRLTSRLVSCHQVRPAACVKLIAARQCQRRGQEHPPGSTCADALQQCDGATVTAPARCAPEHSVDEPADTKAQLKTTKEPSLTTQPVNAESRRPAAPACGPPSRSTGVSAASHRNQKRPLAREPLLQSREMQSCARSASQCRSRFLARVIQLTATVMAWSIRLPRGGRMPTWTAKAIAS